MPAKKSRILVFVPNGATTDNRVIREAESLKKEGHEVLIAGLRLSNLPGRRAISNKGVNVVRVDWQYQAYSKIALAYSLLVLPLVLVISALVAAAALLLYISVLAPWVASIVNMLVSGFYGVIDFFTEEERYAGSPHFSFEAFTVESALAYHTITLLILGIVFRLVQSVVKRLPPKRRVKHKGSNSKSRVSIGIEGLLKRIRHARNYGKDENVERFTFLERVLASDNTFAGRWHEKISTHWVEKARETGFIKVGRDFRPDIIQCHEVGPLPAAIALKTEFGCKIIYEAHEIYDDLANASPMMSRRHRRIHQDCLPYVDALITVNENIADYYSGTYSGIPAPVVLPNSVYPKKVEYDGRLHEAAKLPSEAKILLYQGGFSPRRGLNILLEAAYSLPEDWYVVFMGRGPLENSLRDQAEKLTAREVERFREQKTLETLAVQSQADEIFLSSDTDIEKEGAPEPVASIESYAITESLRRLKDGEDIGVKLKEMTASIRQVREAQAVLTAEKIVSREEVNARLSGKYNKARFVPMAPHSELVEWTSGGTIGVIPYENTGLNHWNCSPNKIWEYPNAGVPLLASRLSYLNYMISKWSIGWTIPSDPKAMDIASAIREIEAQGDLRAKQVSCENFIASDNYIIHEKRLLELISHLANVSHPPGKVI